MSTKSLHQQVTGRIEKHGEGWTFTPRDFADLGDPRLVGTVLTRLVRQGRVRRVRRGLYDCPKMHPILGKAAPDPMAAVRALMEGSSTQWQVSGAYAANLLGLSEQVPGRIVILTNGVPRRMTLGKLTLIFRRAAPRNLLGAGRPAGLVIQAIRHLREHGLEARRLAQLRNKLDADTRSELAALTPRLPAWMRPIVQRLTEKATSC